MAKVDLGPKRVGYISNLHNVAYQGSEDLISPFLTEAQQEFNNFRKSTLKAGEKEEFAVICGDFNFDNISPGKNLIRMWIRHIDFCLSNETPEM